MSQEERSVFWEVIVSAILSKKLYMYMCPIPNGFRDRAIALCSCKIIDKKEILRTVSNTNIYCSNASAGTAYIQYIFENSTININALCNSCEDIPCCSSVQCTVTVQWNSSSRKPFGIGHMYTYNLCLEWPILWSPRILTSPRRTPVYNSQRTVRLSVPNSFSWMAVGCWRKNC
jgi:hypothetical protein